MSIPLSITIEHLLASPTHRYEGRPSDGAVPAHVAEVLQLDAVPEFDAAREPLRVDGCRARARRPPRAAAPGRHALRRAERRRAD
ncbi:MAG: hypothetical protein K2X36_12685, partial [Microbacteriaceae bacterium]|nr:hypothetical protein [Microbacteriaceae bacterium]